MRRVDNPPNPWHSTVAELIGPAPEVRLEIFEEQARSIVAENDSPDLPFRYSLNPYRGCFHACAYCYARPTHQYLDWGAGTDFDRKIVVKMNAPELLRQWLPRGKARDEILAFSGVTDCYQPIEATYEITRRCLEACADFRQPVGIVTKGALVERDIDVLQRLHRRARVFVYVSIPFVDDADGRAIEPFAAPPTRRIETLRRLSEAGIPCGVSLSPVIPGLNDHQMPDVLKAAREAGATRAFMMLLRVPAEVLPVFEQRLQDAFPDRAQKVLSLLTAMRGGNPRDSRFGHRMRGDGPRWQLIANLFSMHCKKLGIATRDEESAFERTRPDSEGPRQGALF